MKSLRRIGTLRLIAYRRIGRVYRLEILKTIVEEHRVAREGQGQDQESERVESR